MLKENYLINKNYESIGLFCKFCLENTHLEQNCSKFHLTANKSLIIKRLNRSFLQKRDKNHIRVNKRSMKPLMNLKNLIKCANLIAIKNKNLDPKKITSVNTINSIILIYLK